MTDDDHDRDDLSLRNRWTRIGLVLFVGYAVATVLAVVLLEIDRSTGAAAILVGSILSSWLLVYYFVVVLE